MKSEITTPSKVISPVFKRLLCFTSMALLVLIYNPVHAQETKESQLFSLADAQTYAVKNNATAKNSAIDIELAKKKIWETTSMGLPQISGKISYQNIFSVPNLTLPVIYPTGADGQPVAKPIGNDVTWNDVHQLSAPIGVKENLTYELNASQLIFSGEYLVGLQASRTFLEFSNQNQKKTELDIKTSVAKSYYLVLVLEENQLILKESLTTIDKILTELTALNKEGFNEETDVDQMRITKSNLDNTLSALKRQIEVSYRLLKFQIGMDINQPIKLSDNLQQFIANVNPQALNSNGYDVSNNIDYQLISTKEKLSLLSLKREESKYLPSIAAFYKHTEWQNVPAINFNPKNVFGIGMDIPLYSSGQRTSRVSQAKLSLEQDRNTKLQVENGLKLTFEQTKSTYISAFEKYQTTKDNVQLSKKIYDRTAVKYKEGLSTSFDLNQAQSQFLTSQANYVSTILDLLNSKTDLDKLNTKN